MNPRHFRAAAHLTLILALATTLGACMDEGNPAGPSPAPTPEPAELLDYRMRIDLSHIKVIEDCDPGITQGAGEFDYWIDVYAAPTQSDRYRHLKRYSGSFSRRNGENFVLNRRFEFDLPEDGKYYVSVKATERDGALNDDDYVGYKHDVNDVGGKDYYEHTLTIGGGSCKLRLYYTATETVLD